MTSYLKYFSLLMLYYKLSNIKIQRGTKMVKLETLFDLFQGFFVSYNQKTFVINYIQVN